MSRTPRILIVGGGYAGFYTAWHLEKRLAASEAEVSILDPRPYMTYQPFLPEGALDVPRLFRNIRLAERTSDVQRGALTHVLVHQWTGDPVTVSIYVANDYDESGFLRTTLAGEVTGRNPYRP